VIPFWILVRNANFVHDYYTLAFFLPLAAWGWKAWLKIASEKVTWVLLGVSILLGAASLAGLKEFPLSQGQLRPSFCDQEIANWVKNLGQEVCN